MKKKYDLAVKIGSYQDAQGNDKGRWQNVGAVMENDDGGKFIFLERWFNPAGVPNPDNRSNVILSMFEPKDRNGEGGGRSNGNGGGNSSRASGAPRNGGGNKPSGGFDEVDEDIPF